MNRRSRGPAGREHPGATWRGARGRRWRVNARLGAVDLPYRPAAARERMAPVKMAGCGRMWVGAWLAGLDSCAPLPLTCSLLVARFSARSALALRLLAAGSGLLAYARISSARRRAGRTHPCRGSCWEFTKQLPVKNHHPPVAISASGLRLRPLPLRFTPLDTARACRRLLSPPCKVCRSGLAAHKVHRSRRADE